MAGIKGYELSYYEYWLTKSVWSAFLAVDMITGCYIMTRSWTAEEDLDMVVAGFRDQIIRRLGKEDAKPVFIKRSFEIAGYNENGSWIEGKIILEDSDVEPRNFVSWLYENGYHMPYEFKAFIGKEDADQPMRQRTREGIDKEVCQGIAKTLWDSAPDMTIEDMRDHKAIQVYGSGKLYSADTTLRRWLSEVDPRDVKRGRRKKV